MMPVPIPQTIRLSVLLQDYVKLPEGYDCELSGIELDSRAVTAGAVFMACKGIQADGRKFIAQAISKGAVAVLVEADQQWNTVFSESGVSVVPVANLPKLMHVFAARFYKEPAAAMRLVGITGTNGKTSCTRLLAELLAQLGSRCGQIGTLGYGMAGQQLEAISAGPGTTPDAVQVQRMFAQLKDDEADTIVMEVTSHALVQNRIDVNDFVLAAFTNLSRDHLDYHHSMEAYGEAKRLLFSGEGLQTVVLNLDDEYSAATRSVLKPAIACLTYGLQDHCADIHADAVEFHAAGFRMDVVTPWGRFALTSSLFGSFNASNLLAVLASALSLQSQQEGFDAAQVVAAACRLQPVSGRMESVGSYPVSVVIDYAHTPDALEQALLALRSHCSGKLHCLFGCGGDRDKGKRAIMGGIAERLADAQLVTDDNPRNEDSTAIIADIVSGFSEPTSAQIIADRAVAIAAVIAQAKPGDLVLIAGKGHETYQEVAGKRIPFSDREYALKVLEQRFGDTGRKHEGSR